MGTLLNSALEQAVNDFTQEMKNRLHEKELLGYTGWDNREEVNGLDLISAIRKDLDYLRNASRKAFQKYCIDIANRAMMLWYRSKNNL